MRRLDFTGPFPPADPHRFTVDHPIKCTFTTGTGRFCLHCGRDPDAHLEYESLWDMAHRAPKPES